MRRPISFLLIATTLAALAGCGKTRTGTIPPKEEAVTLMDRSQNAKAARILEADLRDDPSDDEARLLLASAYMGLAGIDVYRIFDAFQDLLFKRSLKDQIISPKSDPNAKNPLGNGTIPTKDEVKSQAEGTMIALDKSVSSLQLALLYLDRFPQIPAANWPLVEAALAQLESMRNPASDTFTYRILIRLIYLKSYLVEKVMRNEQFGSREWACGFDARSFDEDLSFFTRHALAIDGELGQGAEKGAKALAKAHKNFAFLADAANYADGFSEWSQGMTFSEVENFVKARFNCN